MTLNDTPPPPPLNGGTDITRVSFFEDRALIERRARLQLAKGQQVVTIVGLSPLIDDPSLRLDLGKGAAAEILSSHVRRSQTLPDDERAERERELKALERRRLRQLQRMLTTHRQLERCQALELRWTRGLRRGGTTQEIQVQREAYELLQSTLSDKLRAFGQLQDELDDLDREIARARLLVEEIQRRRPRIEGALELVIDSPEVAEVKLDFSYRAPCALWRPEHRAELFQGPEGWTLRLTSFGCLWQRVSEDWTGVPVTLSTARPSQTSSAPPLQDHNLTLRPKSEEEKRSVAVVTREQTIATTGLGAAPADLPGVDDGGEPVSFRPASPIDVPGDGRPVRVVMASTELPCQLERVAYPEYSQGAHLRVAAVHDGYGTGRLPLLAGPVDLRQDGATLGRSRVGFVAAGQALELGFGLDDSLRVRRVVDKAREITPVIGTQKITFTVTVHVSNLSDEPRALVIKERVPVSEISDVKIIKLGSNETSSDGFASIPLELPGNSTSSVTVSYRVEAGARVRLPW